MFCFTFLTLAYEVSLVIEMQIAYIVAFNIRRVYPTTSRSRDRNPGQRLIFGCHVHGALAELAEYFCLPLRQEEFDNLLLLCGDTEQLVP